MWEITVTCFDRLAEPNGGLDAYSVKVESLSSVGPKTDELIASAVCDEKTVTGVHVHPVF